LALPQLKFNPDDSPVVYFCITGRFLWIYLQIMLDFLPFLCYNGEEARGKGRNEMKILFFDMEFANGKVPGSIYSIGYLVTDEDFNILQGPTDLLINPDAPWNEYVEQNILAYSKADVEAAPVFPSVYDRVCELFETVDLAVGFAVNNDVRALRKNCERYGMPQIRYNAFDTERLCRSMEEHKEAHGLGGYYTAWCGEVPDNQHRSDGDAIATMRLFQKICDVKHVTPEMMTIAYPECLQSSVQPTKKRIAKAAGRADGQKKRRRRRRAPGVQKQIFEKT
jgi:DNA polymerase III epsilon subunit-like protein